MTPRDVPNGAVAHGGVAGGGVAPPVPAAVPVRLGRQGIYDRDRRLVAYELLFRAPGGHPAALRSDAEQDRATSHVISATFHHFGVRQVAGALPLFINLTRRFVTGRLPIPFAPAEVVLELLEDVVLDAEVMAGLRRLQRAGHRIAVDDFAGEECRWPAVRLADYVKIDISDTGERFADVLALTRRLNPAAQVVVERVEEEGTFRACRDLGVELFQGYLLQRPVVLGPGRSEVDCGAGPLSSCCASSA